MVLMQRSCRFSTDLFKAFFLILKEILKPEVLFMQVADDLTPMLDNV